MYTLFYEVMNMTRCNIALCQLREGLATYCERKAKRDTKFRR